MADQNLKSPIPVFAGILVGFVLMLGGYWFHSTQKIAALAELEKQGISIDLGKTISIIGVTLILFPLINSFFITPLREAINNRNSELESTFGEAESLRSEMSALKSDYESRLVKTEENAREQIQAQIREAQAFRDQLKAEASSQAEDYKKRAMAEIDSEKSRVIGDLRLHVVNLTLQATEKVLGENMDNDRNRKLVDDFIEKMEVPV